MAASVGSQTNRNTPSACDANLALIEAFTYDATGNRLSEQIGANPVTTYSYPAQSHRLIQVGAAVRSFDAAGNTLTGVPGYETDSATYDARNRLTQVGSGSSAQLLSNYNGRGERVLVSQGAPAPALPTTSAAWTTAAGVRGHVYDESGQVISMLIAGNPLRYEEIIWLDHTPIGRVESSTSAVIAVHVIHSDHLNTPRALVNAQTQGGQPAGTVIWRWWLVNQGPSGSNAFGRWRPRRIRTATGRRCGLISDSRGSSTMPRRGCTTTTFGIMRRRPPEFDTSPSSARPPALPVSRPINDLALPDGLFSQLACSGTRSAFTQ